MAEPMQGEWAGVQGIQVKRFTCGFCDTTVAARTGWAFQDPRSPVLHSCIVICPHCSRPSFLEGPSQTPGVPFGGKVDHISKDVDDLYQEARRCSSAGAYTAAVLASRKVLMHTAVDKGDDPGKSFMQYVEYLANKGYITTDAKGWVDEIRKRGNEANHEIKIMNQDDAKDLLILVEMLLKIIYEFPGRVPKTAQASGG